MRSYTVRSIWPAPRVHSFAITAEPSAPMPSSRYTVRLGRGLLGLNLAGVMRSGTTRSGLSCRHAWIAGWANRISRRLGEAEPTAGARAGSGGDAGSRRVVSATIRPRSMVNSAVHRATALARWLMMITVRPSCRRPSASTIAASVWGSTPLVGSSSSSTGLSVRNARAGGRDDLLPGRAGHGVRDVLGDARREQHRLLKHHGELPAEIRTPIVPQVHVVEQDPSLRGVIQAGEQTDERALARPGGALDAEARACGDRERHVVQDGAVRGI